MTTNQISYLKYLEDSRHNKAVEEETRRANISGEDIKRDSNAIARFTAEESQRHNYESERQAHLSLKENERSHQVNEQLGLLNYQESLRSNQAKEQIQRAQVNETVRKNLVDAEHSMYQILETERSHYRNEALLAERQAEEHRHNLETEKYGLLSAQANVMKAEQSAKEVAAKLPLIASQVTAADLSNRLATETYEHKVISSAGQAFGDAWKGEKAKYDSELASTQSYFRNVNAITDIAAKTMSIFSNLIGG